MNTLVIHPHDESTMFLRLLYEGRDDVDILCENNVSDRVVRDALRSHERIMLLGHGTEYGLLGCHDLSSDTFSRIVVGCEHVQFLRGKEIIGIWCNANIFGEKYGLHGLFSGMVISELHEALSLGVGTSADELSLENMRYASILRKCIDCHSLDAVPSVFLSMDESHTPLTEFNYSSLYAI